MLQPHWLSPPLVTLLVPFALGFLPGRAKAESSVTTDPHGQVSPDSPPSLPTSPVAQAPDAKQFNPASSVDESIVADPATHGSASDPNLDRSFLFPTAMTQPAGSLTYSNYELFFHGLTLGLTDRVQATLVVLPPYVEDMPLVGALSLKAQVVRADRFHLALQGSLSFSSDDDGPVKILGSVASICLDPRCASLLSANATSLFSFWNNGTFALAYSGSLTQKINEHTKVLFEVASMALFGHGESDNISGALVNYGIRLHGTSFAADIGFFRPILGNIDPYFVLGFPFINFSYRTL